jgi:site-specific recombinase XerD
MTTAIEEFVLYLQAEKGASPRTSSSYRSDLCLFHSLLSAQSAQVYIDDITVAAARSWMLDMKGRGLSNSTIARRMHALKSFWRFLLDTEVVEDERLRKLGIPKRERKLPTYLGMDELRTLLETAKSHPDPLIAARDYALMAVAVYTGVRRSELLGLRLGDLDLTGGVMVVRGKGGKWRMLPLVKEVECALAAWLELRNPECKHDFVFTTLRANRIHPSQMQRIWRRLLTESRIRSEGVSLHTLRHSAATLLLQSGTCDILQIQQLLGHSRLDTTATYLQVAPHSLQMAMERHPLAATSPASEARSPGARVGR